MAGIITILWLDDFMIEQHLTASKKYNLARMYLTYHLTLKHEDIIWIQQVVNVFSSETVKDVKVAISLNIPLP